MESRLAAAAVGPHRWSRRAHDLAWAAVLDTLAIGLAGLAEEQTVVARSTLLAVPEQPGATAPVWLSADHLAVADAAYVGGVACHALDWDDYMHPMHGHYRAGWHATSTVGVLGAAAAAARLLALDEARAGHALGIAASCAAGLRVNFGTPTKALHAGHAARAGVHAALLARAGARSSPGWLTGRLGMAEVMHGDVTSPAAAVAAVDALEPGTHALETPWGLAQKPYACCGSCHAGVDALLSLVDEHDVAADDIEVLELHVDPQVPRVMAEPDPVDPYAARYCLSWVMAVAAFDRALGPAQVSAEALARPEVHALRGRVRVVADLATTDEDRYAGRVVLRTAYGTFDRTVRHASGHPRNPMPADEQRAKRAAALRYAFPAADADRLLVAVEELPAAEALPF